MKSVTKMWALAHALILAPVNTRAEETTTEPKYDQTVMMAGSAAEAFEEYGVVINDFEGYQK